jgi:hypothetical protein
LEPVEPSQFVPASGPPFDLAYSQLSIKMSRVQRFCDCYTSLQHLVSLAGLLTLAPQSTAAPLPKVGPVPDAVRIQFQLDPWYQKHIPAGPLPIVSSSNTSDPALRETAFIVHQLLGNRPDILEALANQAARVVVMAYNEYTTDIPEQRDDA